MTIPTRTRPARRRFKIQNLMWITAGVALVLRFAMPLCLFLESVNPWIVSYGGFCRETFRPWFGCLIFAVPVALILCGQSAVFLVCCFAVVAGAFEVFCCCCHFFRRNRGTDT